MNRPLARERGAPIGSLALASVLTLALAGCGGDTAEESADIDDVATSTTESEPVTTSTTSTTIELPATTTTPPSPQTTTTTTTEPPETTTTVSELTADDIPVAYTPAGGYGDTMPPPVLTECTEPLSDDAVDIRGMWQIVGPENEGEDVPVGAVQRIEQCGNRMVITSGGVVHDMRVDGTFDNGVNDVAARDFVTPVRVAAFWEDGVHVLRPEGVPVEVTRHLDGDQLIWRYVGFAARLDRLGPPEMNPPAA